MKRLIPLSALITALLIPAASAAASTLPGYYWSTARMTAAVHLYTWENLGSGLRCTDQGQGTCNFTLTCRGLASSPISTPAVRDILKVGAQVRFRYFHCVVVSRCLLNGSWWQDYQTRTDAPQSLASDARHVRQLGNLAPRANPAGC